MSQIALPEKQQALIRVASSRVAVIDSASSVKEHSCLCVQALPVSPSTLVRIVAATGTVASVAGALIGLNRKRKNAEKRASEMKSQSLVGMIIQLLLPLALPYVQKILSSKGVVSDSHNMKF
jgi:hypothetical protein